jgi:MoxR-like ATPase
MSWKYFNGNCNEDNPQGLTNPPERPPWRQFLPREEVDKTQDDECWNDLRELAKKDARSIQRGKSFRVRFDENGSSEIVDAVNAAIHLRRPLLVTGAPGSGKTTLAYAIAHELQLGSVLTWPITARSNLVDAEYRYDAIARLQDAQLDKTRQPDKEAEKTPKNEPKSQEEAEETPKNEPKPREEGDLGDYIQLGSVGTAFLPSLWPRVLLIDEIDKSDLNLPNDLLNLFEEGEFEIPELVRRKRRRGDDREKDFTVEVRTADQDRTALITNGRVKCCEFPIVIMTSNGEREFPPAFYRRCLRVKMPDPTPESLLPIVRSHFDKVDRSGWTRTEKNLTDLIAQFLDRGNKADRATDQLLNAIYLMTRDESPSEEEMKRLLTLLLRRLSEAN